MLSSLLSIMLLVVRASFLSIMLLVVRASSSSKLQRQGTVTKGSTMEDWDAAIEEHEFIMKGQVEEKEWHSVAHDKKKGKRNGKPKAKLRYIVGDPKQEAKIKPVPKATFIDRSPIGRIHGEEPDDDVAPTGTVETLICDDEEVFHYWKPFGVCEGYERTLYRAPPQPLDAANDEGSNNDDSVPLPSLKSRAPSADDSSDDSSSFGVQREPSRYLYDSDDESQAESQAMGKKSCELIWDLDDDHKTVSGKKYIYCPHHDKSCWVLEVNGEGILHKIGCKMLAEAVGAPAPVARTATKQQLSTGNKGEDDSN
jgi:hypothetical protein